ncbi:dhhc zinc finger domain-containing protein [Nannochloropsis oceanica]
MLSPIAESPQKERAAEQDEEEGITATVRARAQHKYELQANDEEDEGKDEGEEEEDRLLNVYSRRRWSRLETMEIESGRKTPTRGPGTRSTSSYRSLGTQDSSSFGASPGEAATAGAGGGGGAAAAAGATHNPPRFPSSSSSSTYSSGAARWRSPLNILVSTRNVMSQIMTFSRGGMECPLPFLCDEDHPDPCECLCNLIQMPRVPAARHHYLIYRSPAPIAYSSSSLPSSSSSRNERIYTIGPHWAGLVFTIFLVCLASYLFITHVALELGSIFVCRLYTGPTAQHCEDCKVCIEGLDHHCPWMGHCVGKGNLGAFLCFNCVWLTYVLFVLGCLAAQGGVFGREGAGAGGMKGGK